MSLFDTEKLESITTQLTLWADAHLFNWSTLVQVIIATATMLVALVFARRLSKWVRDHFEAWRHRHLDFLASRVHLPLNTVLFIFLWPILLWIAIPIALTYGFPTTVLSILANLMTAWAIIRLSSSMIKSVFWSNVLAFSIWVIAALNMLGWLEATTSTLNDIAIQIGEFRLSVLIVLKGALVFGILLWLARLASEGLEYMFGRSQHLNISQKALFNKLTRFGLLALAIMIGLTLIGIDLTALAVFSGAVGIGIGLGLQKVFANLVSGFILLMDKSIKPGDVIAVEDTYGWVNRLGARYVSILTRDGKEHLIPNETLIIEKVENWSYSDDKVRIRIPVGVSYHSDIHLVRNLLMEVIQNCDRALDNPAPNCLVTGFGDSSVDFEMRVWIRDPVNGIGNVRSEIYMAVWDKFKEHDIEIPFPQRDIHIKADSAEAFAALAKPAPAKKTTKPKKTS